MELLIFDTPLEVAKNFSSNFCELVKSKDIVHVALSGGSTPKIVFEELTTHYGAAIPWDRLHLYWGDERCVPPDDDDSNYKMTRDNLISKIDIPESNVHRIQGESRPDSEARRYGSLLNEKLPESNGIPQFDLVILGMGGDGHTASIFPHEIELWHSTQNCEVAIHPESGQRRISLTGKIINNAIQVAFLVTGEGKKEKVREILKKEGEYRDYPASLVKPSSGELFWYLDNKAASGLTTE